MRQGAAAPAALALTAAGCGGGSGDLTFADFQREANGICIRYARSVNALPKPHAISGIAGQPGACPLARRAGEADRGAGEHERLRPRPRRLPPAVTFIPIRYRIEVPILTVAS